MRIKKYFGQFTIVLEILSDYKELEFEDVLSDICRSFDESKLLNKTIIHNELVKQQQKYPKHILIPFEVEYIDNLRILLKLINNFLTTTNQSKYFMMDMPYVQGDEEIIAYGNEIYLNPIDEITFSPIARSFWSNPQLINTIIHKG